MLNHCVFTDGDFRLNDPELLIVNGCDIIFQTYICMSMVPTITDRLIS